MKMKRFACVVGLLLTLAISVPAYSSPLWSFQDDDVEAILRSDGSGGFTAVTSGNLAVGDIFYSVFELPSFAIDGVNALPAGQELTGVAAVQLLAIVGSGGTGTQYIFGAADLQSIISFYGYTGAALPGTYVAPTLTSLGQGPSIAMFLNSTSGAGGDTNLNLDATLAPTPNCASGATSISTCTIQATLGSLFQVDGFVGDPDEFWVAVQLAPGGGNIGTVLASGVSTQIAGFNAALSNIFNAGGAVGFQTTGTLGPSGVECFTNAYVADGCAQLLGSGNVLGGAGLAGTGFIAHSDFDATKYVVPEPATLSLLGLGLLGLGVIRMRKKK